MVEYAYNHTFGRLRQENCSELENNLVCIANSSLRLDYMGGGDGGACLQPTEMKMFSESLIPKAPYVYMCIFLHLKFKGPYFSEFKC